MKSYPKEQTCLLTVPEAAEELGISQSHAYRLAAGGLIPTIKVGKSLRVPARALERWIEENTVGGCGHE